MPRVRPLFVLPAVFAASAAVLGLAQAPARYDLLVRNGRVVDGAGNPWFAADVAVRGDTIVAVGRGLAGEAARVIDAAGQVVSPGFIDIHTHARRGIFDVPTADNYVRQGVTTLIEGPDGGSALPLGPFLEKVRAARVSVNLGSFVGQGTVREAVMGNVDRPATPDELPILDGVHAEQRPLQPEVSEDPLGGGTRPEERQAACLLGDLAAERVERDIGRGGGGFLARDATPIVGHQGHAVQPRGDAARGQRALVDVHDLPLDSITTTIEADMCDVLGREGPPPVQPVDGVLW